MDDSAIGFIGAGTLAKGLSLALVSKGYRVVAASSRRLSSAEALATKLPGCKALPEPQQVADQCDLVFITTSDEAIHGVASAVEWHAGQGVAHCSGAESLSILEPAARLGAYTGSFHPFQTFACVETSEEALDRLQGVAFAVEGDGWLLPFLQRLATNLGGQAIAIAPHDRAIYHASGAMACGYLVALLKAATDIWTEMGFRPEEALPMLLPLSKSTLTNVSRSGIDAGITGPVVRGDAITIHRHLEALEARLPHLVPLYCSLALACLPLAKEKVGVEVLEDLERTMNAHLHRHLSTTLASPSPPGGSQDDP